MGIDTDAQKDLALDDADAENVVGGVKKKAKHAPAKPAAHQATGHSLPTINVQGPVVASSDAPVDDCDPGETPA